MRTVPAFPAGRSSAPRGAVGYCLAGNSLRELMKTTCLRSSGSLALLLSPGCDPAMLSASPGATRKLPLPSVSSVSSSSRLERLAVSQDRHTALSASQWLSVLRENAGDGPGAMRAAQRTLALASDDEGPWATAMPRTMLAQLTMHMGDRAAAVGHARAVLPVMRRRHGARPGAVPGLPRYRAAPVRQPGCRP